MGNDDAFNQTTNWNHARYMLEKLTNVITTLVAGEGDAYSRLRKAIPDLQKVIPGMLPLDCKIRERVEKAYTILKTAYVLHPSNSLEITTSKRIRNSTGAKIINELFGAWLDLRDLVHNHFGY